MSDTLAALAEALRQRLAIIGDEESRREPAKHMARLEEISGRIEALEKELPTNLDPQLRHYLQRRSYSKALAQIEALAP